MRCIDTFGEVLGSFGEVARQFFTPLCLGVDLKKGLATVTVPLKLDVFWSPSLLKDSLKPIFHWNLPLRRLIFA